MYGHTLIGIGKEGLFTIGYKDTWMRSDGGVLSCTPCCCCINYNSLRTGELVQFCVKTKSEDINQDLQTSQIPVCGSLEDSQKKCPKNQKK